MSRSYTYPSVTSKVNARVSDSRYGTILLEVASATIILTPMSHGRISLSQRLLRITLADASFSLSLAGMCGRVYWIQPLTIVFVIIVCQTLMSIRIYAIYERERKMGFLYVRVFIS